MFPNTGDQISVEPFRDGIWTFPSNISRDTPRHYLPWSFPKDHISHPPSIPVTQCVNKTFILVSSWSSQGSVWVRI